MRRIRAVTGCAVRAGAIAVGCVLAVHVAITLAAFGPDHPIERITDDEPIVSGRHPFHMYHAGVGRGGRCALAADARAMILFSAPATLALRPPISIPGLMSRFFTASRQPMGIALQSWPSPFGGRYCRSDSGRQRGSPG